MCVCKHTTTTHHCRQAARYVRACQVASQAHLSSICGCLGGSRIRRGLVGHETMSSEDRRCKRNIIRSFSKRHRRTHVITIRVGEKWNAAVARLHEDLVRYDAWRNLIAYHACLTCFGFMLRPRTGHICFRRRVVEVLLYRVVMLGVNGTARMPSGQ
jgi:hypothetical protein